MGNKDSRKNMNNLFNKNNMENKKKGQQENK